MRWGFPELLPWLLLLLPLTWAVMALTKRRERRLRQLVAPEVTTVLAPAFDPRQMRRRNMLWLLAVGLAALSLARPQWGFHWQEVKRRGLDVIVVLDTSRSMLTQDIKPDRLQQAKWGVRDLVRKLTGDRIGLVTFAGSSFLECPRTVDYAAFLLTLDDAYVGSIPKGGTAITQALRTAAESFGKDTQADRAIVLITDGEDHEGNPLSLVSDLKKMNIRVYAVGVGTADGELIPDESGTGFLKDRDGNVVKSALHEDVLGQLALQTDGAYARSAPGDFGLERIFDEGISQLKKDEQDARMIRAHEDRFVWPLGLALFTLVAEAALGRKKIREGST